MADESPIQNAPEDESKKDTVRINLPPGVGNRPGAPGSGSPTPTVRLKPAAAPTANAPEDESKKETAVMGTPVATPKPKKDTSRVQVPAAKPGVPEMPRPTVKLKREESSTNLPAATPPVAPMPSAAPQPAAAAISGVDVGLAIAAMLVALASAGYLYSLS